MTATNLIQIIAAALGVIGSLFFAIGILRQSPVAMAQLAATYWNSNPDAVPALAAQKAAYVFGGLGARSSSSHLRPNCCRFWQTQP